MDWRSSESTGERQSIWQMQWQDVNKIQILIGLSHSQATQSTPQLQHSKSLYPTCLQLNRVVKCRYN